MTSRRGIFSLVAAAAVATPMAQATDEIIVSAQRRDADIQDVPISVTALSADDMARLQIDFVADIGKNVPNLQTYTVTAGGAAMQVFMRGAGVQNPGFNASEAPVGIYIDDVYRGRVGTANLELADVERIEVLRGPQGTLYGRNTIAGAIKVVTRTPGEDFYANGSVGYGEFDTSKITASVGGEVFDGVGMSIAGLYNNRGEGWIDRGSVGGRELGEYENSAVRAKFNLFGDDVFKAVGTLEYIDAENDGYNGIPYGPSRSPASSPGMPLEGFYDTLVPDSTVGRGLTEQINAALDLSWELSAVTIRSITGYSKIDDEFAFDLNGGTNPFAPATVISPVGGLFIESNSWNDTFSQEFTLSGSTENFDWITGAFFMKEQGRQFYRVNYAGAQSLREDQRTNTTSYAIFGEGTWSLSDRWSLIAGVRWSLDDKEYTNSCTRAFCGGDWTTDIGDNFNEFTPRLIVQYQLNDDVMLFGGVSRGYQAGGFQTLCFGNQACSQVIYDPQTVVSWEGGVKSELWDNRLRLNVSAFYAQYDNMQQTAIDTASGSFPVQNVGDADVTGLEIEAYLNIAEGWDVWTIIGLADDDISDSALAALPATTMQLPGLPRATVRAGIDYRTSLMADWDLIAGVDMNYADDYYATINNVLEISNYVRWNGRIGLEQPEGNWSVILSGTNLDDAEDLFSGIAGNGTNIRTPQPPREYMLTVNYRY